MPISTFQDIVDKGACHAALVSGEVRIGYLNGIVLQVIAASGCPNTPACSLPSGMLPEASCCSRVTWKQSGHICLSFQCHAGHHGRPCIILLV